MTLTLTSLNPLTTTVQSLKESVQAHLGGPSVVGIDKIKILLNKKPIPPSKKTVAEALEGGSSGTTDVEFGVMVMGGAPDPPPQVIAPVVATPVTLDSSLDPKPAQSSEMEGVESTPSDPVQPGKASGSAVLESPEFWDDLQGFLQQRLRDQAEAERVRGIFERAFKSASSAP